MAVLAMVLVISCVAVLAFLVIPLAVRGGRKQERPVRLLYFVAIGLGYILVEIAFIQRFVSVSRAPNLRPHRGRVPAFTFERRRQPGIA